MPASEKFKNTIEIKNQIPSEKNQILFNMIAVKKEITLKEMKNELIEKTGNSFSVSKVFRKVKDLGITRKRLSLIPEERNSERISG